MSRDLVVHHISTVVILKVWCEGTTFILVIYSLKLLRDNRNIWCNTISISPVQFIKMNSEISEAKNVYYVRRYIQYSHYVRWAHLHPKIRHIQHTRVLTNAMWFHMTCQNQTIYLAIWGLTKNIYSYVLQLAAVDFRNFRTKSWKQTWNETITFNYNM